VTIYSTEAIADCLQQLNNLLVAAHKNQPGQVNHRVRRAREELDALRGAAERSEEECRRNWFATEQKLRAMRLAMRQALEASE
jgi:hypothetical protein